MTPLDLADPEAAVVVVGSGLAGCQAAETLRVEGFAGRIILVGDEPHEPYDRPPLSKQALLDGDAAPVPLVAAARWAELDIDLRTNLRVIAIDRPVRRLVCADGSMIDYSRLVLATGSRVRTIAALPPGPSVHYLRTLDDARRLRTALVSGARLAVVGAGVIGLEVAAVGAQMGLDVTVIEQGARVMARGAGAELSGFLHARHVDRGVTLRLGVAVDAAWPTDAGIVLRLSDGDVIEADFSVVGIGVLPNAELATEAGLETHESGILVDAYGRTGDPLIHAAGEVAYHENVRSGRRERQESWTHAQHHGALVARAILGAASGYDVLPYYWTDQYDFSVQVVGSNDGAVNVVRGDLASGRFAVFHLDGDALVGASVVGGSPAMRAIRKLVEAGAAITPGALADPAFDLKLAAAALR